MTGEMLPALYQIIPSSHMIDVSLFDAGTGSPSTFTRTLEVELRRVVASLYLRNRTSRIYGFLHYYPGWMNRLLTHPVRGLDNFAEMMRLLIRREERD